MKITGRTGGRHQRDARQGQGDVLRPGVRAELIRAVQTVEHFRG